jgi:hypothetical protein
LSYNRTYWQNHVTEYENRYTVTQNPDGTENHIPVEGEILQQGTPQNKTNFNNLEEGVLAAHELAAENARVILFHERDLKNLNGEQGETTLTNSQEYPFNNSEKTIDLATRRDKADYTVEIDIGNAANVGRVKVYDKQLNGFKIAHTGSAASVPVKYVVRGGFYN